MTAQQQSWHHYTSTNTRVDHLCSCSDSVQPSLIVCDLWFLLLGFGSCVLWWQILLYRFLAKLDKHSFKLSCTVWPPCPKYLSSKDHPRNSPPNSCLMLCSSLMHFSRPTIVCFPPPKVWGMSPLSWHNDLSTACRSMNYVYIPYYTCLIKLLAY